MKLIHRYVYDVARRLPEKQRDEVTKELTAEIYDMGDHESNGKKLNDAAIRRVLVQLGNPRLLADRYREKPRYLVGPEYYESYISLLKTLFAVIVPLVVFILWTTLSLSTKASAVDIVWQLIGAALEVSVHIFFWTTLSFMIVQKVANGAQNNDSWKPDDLPVLPPEQEISRGESYFALAWSVFAVIATLYQIPAIYNVLNFAQVPQFFGPSMWPGWTLGLLAVSIIGLATEGYKLYVGGWTKRTVWLVAVVNVVTIVFFLTLINVVQSIANPEAMQLIGQSLGKPDIAANVDTGITIFVYFITVLSIWEIGEAIYKYRKGGNK